MSDVSSSISPLRGVPSLTKTFRLLFVEHVFEISGTIELVKPIHVLYLILFDHFSSLNKFILDALNQRWISTWSEYVKSCGLVWISGLVPNRHSVKGKALLYLRIWGCILARTSIVRHARSHC